MPRKLFRYQVLTGTHITSNDTSIGPTSPNGDKFETVQDLLHHNLPGHQPRFKLLGTRMVNDDGTDIEKEVVKEESSSDILPTDQVAQAGAPKEKDDGLDTQSMGELRAFAKDAGIDILGLNRKDEVIAAIRRAIAVS